MKVVKAERKTVRDGIANVVEPDLDSDLLGSSLSLQKEL